MFTKQILDIKSNLFDELLRVTEFEDICDGRMGAVLVDSMDGMIPIVRTTTAYNKPSQPFVKPVYEIIDSIKSKFGNINFESNNAMIEVYGSKYRKMGFHTDQSLDLRQDSNICIFSCYENGSDDSDDLRKLKIKNKTTGELTERLMENGSVIIFDTSTNHEHLHKIVLESNKSNKSKNRWLGITFRLSGTFIKFVDTVPRFNHTNEILRIATDDEMKEFRKYKGIENSDTNYVYPAIDYTVSPSDCMIVKNNLKK
jgi:hypothetical protein